jgi:Flp pilus assembly protein TadB
MPDTEISKDEGTTSVADYLALGGVVAAIIVFVAAWLFCSFWTAIALVVALAMLLVIGFAFSSDGFWSVAVTGGILFVTAMLLANQYVRISELESRMDVYEAFGMQAYEAKLEEAKTGRQTHSIGRSQLMLPREVGQSQLEYERNMLLFRYFMLFIIILVFGGACRRWGKLSMSDATETGSKAEVEFDS